MKLATVHDMASRPRKTPLRALTIDPPIWNDFGDSSKTAGTTRPDFLREFIDWVNANPQLWRHFRESAERRGDTTRAAIQRALTAYIDGQFASADESAS
jgi:hypothetical protein